MTLRSEDLLAGGRAIGEEPAEPEARRSFWRKLGG
jgi:hypothetical protein